MRADPYPSPSLFRQLADDRQAEAARLKFFPCRFAGNTGLEDRGQTFRRDPLAGIADAKHNGFRPRTPGAFLMPRTSLALAPVAVRSHSPLQRDSQAAALGHRFNGIAGQVLQNPQKCALVDYHVAGSRSRIEFDLDPVSGQAFQQGQPADERVAQIEGRDGRGGACWGAASKPVSSPLDS